MIPFTKKAKELQKIKLIMEKIKEIQNQNSDNYSLFNSKYGKEAISKVLDAAMKSCDSSKLEFEYSLFEEWDKKGFMSSELGNFLESLIEDENYQIGIHRVGGAATIDPNNVLNNDLVYNICSKGLYLTGHTGAPIKDGKNPLYLNISPLNNILQAVQFSKAPYKGSRGGFIIAMPSKYVDKELNIKDGHEFDLCDYVDDTWTLDPKYIVGYISQDDGVCNFYTRAELMDEYEKLHGVNQSR